MAYVGTSIVDYLKSVGQPSDFASRAKLATEKGITDYTGTAEQNLRLLSLLQTPTPTPLAPTTTPPLTAAPGYIPPTPIPGAVPPLSAAPGYKAPTTPTPTTAYTGVSIVDYLTSVGQPSDYTSRAKLAAQYGIANYTGTAEQNTQLLSILRSGFKPTTPTPATTNIPLVNKLTDVSQTDGSIVSKMEGGKLVYYEYQSTPDKYGIAGWINVAAPAGTSTSTQTTTPIPPVTPPVTPPPVTPEDWMKQTWDLMSKYPEAVKEAYKPVAEAITSLMDAIRNRPSLVEEYKRMMTEYKMPEMTAELARLQSRANAIEEQIEALPEDVKQRVKNFLMTQTQYERVTAAEAAPLTKLFNALARASTAKATEIAVVRGEVSDILGLMSKDADRTEEVLKWGLEGAKSQAELETTLASKGIEFMKWGAEMGLKVEEITAKAAKAPTLPTSVQEYEYAVNQGYKGTYAEWAQGGTAGFTAVEQRKLEQAGLLSASRQQQLGFLYGKEPKEETAYERETQQLADMYVTIPDWMKDPRFAGVTNPANVGLAKQFYARLTLEFPQLASWQLKAAMDAYGMPTGFIPGFAY